MKIAAALTLCFYTIGVRAQPPEPPPAAPPLTKAPPSIVPSVALPDAPRERESVLNMTGQNVSVGNVIAEIARATKVQVEMAPGSRRRGERIIENLAFVGLNAQDALRLVAQMSGLAVATDGQGFRIENDPQVKMPTTKANQSLWERDGWQADAKPFVLALRLSGQAGEADEAASEIQVAEHESFAFTLRAGGFLYGVQGKADSVVLGKDGRRELPVRLRIMRRAAEQGAGSTILSTQLHVPLDESDLPVGGTVGGFAPVVSARDNADYKAPK